MSTDDDTLLPESEPQTPLLPTSPTPTMADSSNLRPPPAAVNMPLLITNYILLFAGTVSSTLLSRYYFIHKGSSRWVSTLVQSAAFPLLLPPIYLPYYLLRSTGRRPFSHFTPRVLVISVLVGLMLGVNNLLFSWSNSYLPVSTSSILLSSQLIFTLLFSFLIVKHKITFHNLNSVVLLSLASLLLAFVSSDESPPGETRAHYFLGFACTVGAGLLFALYLPLMEKVYREVDCYAMVIEMQLVMEAAATVFALVGMAASGDGMREMRRESAEVFDKGAAVYWMTVVGTAATWQMCFVGTAGMVYLTSSVTGGVCMTALLGMNVVAGVVVYGEAFGGVKGVATALCVWGFCSYVYGKYKAGKDEVEKREEEEAEEEEDGEKSCGGGGENVQYRRMEMSTQVEAAAENV